MVCVVNHLWLLARGLHLDSAATQKTEASSTALASPSDASGHIDKVPILAQHAEQGAFISTTSVLPLHGILAGNPGHSVGKVARRRTGVPKPSKDLFFLSSREPERRRCFLPHLKDVGIRAAKVMNLVSFSVKTKGIHNFARRLWTVFTRFGFSEAQTRRALRTVVDTLRQYNATPTFFIPAVVLRRHPALLREIVGCGAEIGIHGYIHNDYRTLSKKEQLEQTKQATLVFQETQIPYEGFRNPYLGWTEDSIDTFVSLDFTYDSNEAIFHDVIDLNSFSPLLRSGYEKSLALFQAIPCNAYTLRPHFEGKLLRIPTSIPDDEMLFDRLRITDPKVVGRIWSRIMQRVYDFGGLYTLNLHPERAILCKKALYELLSFAHTRPLPVWLTNLKDIAEWWKERSQFRLNMNQLTANRWQVIATCSPQATLLARYLTVEDQPLQTWSSTDNWLKANHFVVTAAQRPCIGLSIQTPLEVADFLHTQGYPTESCPREKATEYALYLDIPEGLGTTRKEQIKRRSALVQQIEQVEAPLLHFGCWPDGHRAALAITGDIDSVTVQDFFLRIIEAYQYS